MSSTLRNVVAVAVVLATSRFVIQGAHTQKPNIVVIWSDDIGMWSFIVDGSDPQRQQVTATGRHGIVCGEQDQFRAPIQARGDVPIHSRGG